MKRLTKEEKTYHDKVRLVGCVINNSDCGGNRIIHHKTGAGMARKTSHWDVIGLCDRHHTTGGYGIALHAGQEAWEEKYGTQDELIKLTKELVERL